MEFIGSGIEAEDASLEIAARREAEEEAGYTGGKVHTFLAIGGTIDREQNLEVVETLTVEKIPFKKVIEEMSAPSAVYQRLYASALFHAMHFIRTSDNPELEH